MKEAERRIRVEQRAGKALKQYLVRSDPFKAPNCENEDWRVCKTDPALNCKTRDAIYQINCATCGENCIGKTARSLGKRCNQHIKKT